MSTLSITKSYHIHTQSFENVLMYDRHSVKYTKIVLELLRVAELNLHLPFAILKMNLKQAERDSKAKSSCYLYTDNNRIECSTKGGFPQWYVIPLEDYINLP